MEEKKLTAIEQTEQDAKNGFRQGLNCAECVVGSFMEHYETPFGKDVIALATGFGGGMGHTKNTCGAVTGAVMALSMVVGRREPMAKETMAERIQELNGIYGIVGRMVEEAKAEYGTLICSELSAPHGDFEGKARKKSCMQMIGYCAALAAKYAEESGAAAK